MWYDFIRPNKKSIIVSIVAMIIWLLLIYFLLGVINCPTCIYNPASVCGGPWPKLINNCDCCFTAGDFFGQLFGYFIIPLIIFYIFFSSLFFMFERTKKS